MGTLIPSPQFCCGPKTALKKTVIKYIDRTMVNITVFSVQWTLLSLFYLSKLIAFSQQQNKILSMKTWDLQSLNNILIVIYFVYGGCKIQIQIWMQSQLLWMDWPLICAASGVHRIFPDSWTLRRSCPRWLISSCYSQRKFLASQ